MAAHALELDDGSKYATYHPGASIIPACLALGEAEGISGKQLLEAITAGYEVSLRIGTAINPGHYLRGFHPTGTIASFGTTAAAAKILGLSPELTVQAMGIAGSLASGINQYEIDGSISKHVHPGNAARNGILAAMLARDGMTGPAEILEGKLGFFHCFADSADTALVDRDLGEDWHFLRIYFKPYCSCRYVHYAIEATQKDLEQRPFPPEEIASIVVRTHRNAKQGSDIRTTGALHAVSASSTASRAILVREAAQREYGESHRRPGSGKGLGPRADRGGRRDPEALPNPLHDRGDQDQKGNTGVHKDRPCEGGAGNPMSRRGAFSKNSGSHGRSDPPERRKRSCGGHGNPYPWEIASFTEMLHI